MAAEPARILVTKLKQIGDVLLATPAIAALRRQRPAARIAALVPPAGAAVLQGNPDLDEVWAYRGGSALGGLLLRWRRFQPDWVVELGLTRKERILGRLGGGGCRVGFAADGRRGGLTESIPFDWTAHIVENSGRLLRLLGVEGTLGTLALQVDEFDRKTVRARLRSMGVTGGQGLAVVHPVTRWTFKSAGAEATAAAIDGLRDRLGLTVLLTSGPEPAERERAARIRSLIRGPVADLTGQLSLGEFAALVSLARLVITVDGAPMHMAAALQVPQVVLFGPTGEANWGPWRAPHRLLGAPYVCRPCGRAGCLGTKVSDCLQAVTAGQILDAAATLLQPER